MSARAWVLSVALPLAFVAAGCAPKRGDEVKAAAKVMARERTPEKLFERGKVFAMVGDATRAEQYLKAAIEAGGDERQVVPVLLDVLVTDKRYRAAIEVSEEYVRRRPQESSMRFVLATLDRAVGDTDAARRELTRVLAAQPENAEAHFSLGVLLRDDDADPSAADLQFREYLRIDPKGTHCDEARGSLVHRLP